MEELLVSIAAFIILYIATKHLFHKLQNFPATPFPSLPIIGHLHLFKAPFHRTLTALSNRYGAVFLLQLGIRRVLVVSSPAAAEDCLSKNDVVFANRPRLLPGDLFGYHFTNILWAPYGDTWRSLRRIASTEIFSSHRLNLLSRIRAEEIESMLRRIHRSAVSAAGGVVDVKTALYETTNNVMMRMVAGKRYFDESMESAEGRKFIELLEREAEGVTTIGDFLPVVRWAGVTVGQETRFRDLFMELDAFIQNLVNQHRQKKTDSGQDFGSNHKTMIDVLLSLQKKDPLFFTEDIVKGMVLVLLTAGTDTSAGTMEWTMSLLLNHPSILKKAQAEIDTQVGQDRLINESDLANLPYLRSIINETLRMYPMVPLLVPRESSDECVVGGYKVQRGTMLMVNVWAIQNDPTVWEEPRKFNPERFEGMQLGGEGSRFKMMAFGSGRRACPGEGLGMRVVGLGVGSMLQCFEWGRVGDELVDMEEGKSRLTMPKAKPLLAKCCIREHMKDKLV